MLIVVTARTFGTLSTCVLDNSFQFRQSVPNTFDLKKWLHFLGGGGREEMLKWSKALNFLESDRCWLSIESHLLHYLSLFFFSCRFGDFSKVRQYYLSSAFQIRLFYWSYELVSFYIMCKNLFPISVWIFFSLNGRRLTNVKCGYFALASCSSSSTTMMFALLCSATYLVASTLNQRLGLLKGQSNL